MLVECGFVRAVTSDGQEFTFRPSLARIASLGDPHEIVRTYAALHGPNAGAEAAYVLACLCDQDDPTPLIGWRDETGWHLGAMPEAEAIIIARHLMQHGIAGTAKPQAEGETAEGAYTDRFDAAEYIAAARVHLGLSSADAEALSMTELQRMFAMKFPKAAASDGKGRELPSREAYDAAMRKLKERNGG